MKRAILIFSAVLLAGCSSVAERQQRAADALKNIKATASGAVTEGQEVVEGVIQGVTEIKKRAEQVKTGVEKVNEGKKLIQESIGVE